MSIGHSETRNRYNILHAGNKWIGISGIAPSWIPRLKRAGIPINSLRAGLFVYKYYLKECRGNEVCAMKKFKGSISPKTLHIVMVPLKAYKQIVELEKQRKKGEKKK
jgi:hypothetical protein